MIAAGAFAPSFGDAVGVPVLVTATEYGGNLARLEWAFRGDDSAVMFGVYVDDELTQIVQGVGRDRYAAFVQLPTYTNHDVSVIPFPRWFEPPREVYGEGGVTAFRAALKWGRVTGAHGYIIERSATSGGTYAAIGSVSRPTVEVGVYDANEADGFISIGGAYKGDDVRGEVFTLAVVEPGLAEITPPGRLVPFVPSMPFDLFDGITATIDGNCAAGDSVDFFVGVRPAFKTAPLSSGEHWFRVSSYDAAGNVSVAGTPFRVIVPARPLPAENVLASWHEPTSTATVTFAVNAGTPEPIGFRLLANYDPATDAIVDDWVEVDSGEAFVDEANAALCVISGAAAGTYRFAVQITSGAVTDGTLNPVELVLPVVPAGAPEVVNLAASASVGGAVVLTWYTAAPVASGTFAVAEGSTSNVILATVAASPTFAGAFFRYTATISAAPHELSDGETGEFFVRANTGGPWSTGAEVVVDMTAPDTPAGLQGMVF